MPGRVVVQWDKEDCADMKIVKVDLLGLGMMAVLEECLELVPKHYDEPLDLAQLPADDPLVYETLRRADTVGMFQVESRAQMASLPRNAPVKFYDLVVQVAIIRPGPIVGKMMHPYMRRRQGREEVSYAHPSLKPILERTLGVPLFQEQLLRMAMTAANFTGGEAEDLRRAMGFKRSESRMRDIELKLRRGMEQNGIQQRNAGRNHHADHLVRSLWVSRIARRQFCADRLRQRLPQVSLPGRIHSRLAEQSADGFLQPGHDRQGCTAARPACEANQCGAVRMALHDRARSGQRR